MTPTNIVTATTNAVAIVQANDVVSHDITRWILIPIIFITIAVAVARRMEIRWPEFKWKWTGWVSMRMVISIAVWMFITLTFIHFQKETWEKFLTDRGWWAWTAYIVATIIFCALFGRKVTKSEAKSGHGGGQDSHSGGGLWKFAVVVIVVMTGLGLLGGILEGFRSRNQPTRGRQGQTVDFAFTAYPTRWTEIWVGRGTNFVWDKPLYDAVVLYRRNSNYAEANTVHGVGETVSMSPFDTPYCISFMSTNGGPVRLVGHFSPSN